MGKKKPTPEEAGKGKKTLASYYPVLVKLAENKNKEKSLKNDKITAFSAGNNDNTNDNSTTTTTTTTTRPEIATTMGTDTAPANEENELGLGKTEGEESERSTQSFQRRTEELAKEDRKKGGTEDKNKNTNRNKGEEYDEEEWTENK